MTKEAAEAILYGAQNDYRFGQLHDSLLEYIVKKFGYFPYKVRIQILLGAKNKLACNAFWDGNFEKVVYFLRAYGLGGNYYNPKPSKASDTHIVVYRNSGKLSAPKHDWKYVK